LVVGTAGIDYGSAWYTLFLFVAEMIQFILQDTIAIAMQDVVEAQGLYGVPAIFCSQLQQLTVLPTTLTLP
jgi:hypothetical protein